MIRTSEEYCEPIRDGRQVHIKGKVLQTAEAKVTGHGGFLGTRVAAVRKQRA